jgi:hypothetical protein
MLRGEPYAPHIIAPVRHSTTNAQSRIFIGIISAVAAHARSAASRRNFAICSSILAHSLHMARFRIRATCLLLRRSNYRPRQSFIEQSGSAQKKAPATSVAAVRRGRHARRDTRQNYRWQCIARSVREEQSLPSPPEIPAETAMWTQLWFRAAEKPPQDPAPAAAFC